MRLVLINLLFWVAAGGAWAWFHVAPPEPPVRYRLTPRPEVAGMRFTAEPVGEAAAEILATTNLVNGSFMARDGTRITAFLGTWSAENSKELSVVSHTPDICWVGAGWTPVFGRHPDRVELELDGVGLPFECRTFRAPGSLHEELTVWCTLVNGRVTGETGRFAAPVDPGSRREERWALQGRRLASSHFFDALKNRSAGRGDKQFVRFSTRLDGDWQRSLKELQSFGRQWLSLSSETPDPAPNPPVPSP